MTLGDFCLSKDKCLICASCLNASVHPCTVISHCPGLSNADCSSMVHTRRTNQHFLCVYTLVPHLSLCLFLKIYMLPTEKSLILRLGIPRTILLLVLYANIELETIEGIVGFSNEYMRTPPI